jgi:cytochrome o ubiquinol oxidase subunit 3
MSKIAAHPHDTTDKTLFGFWAYLMTDLVLFATLFAAYAVLHNNTFGGPSGKDLFDMPFVLTETMLLLTSSFTAGLAMLAVYAKRKTLALSLLFITFLLGATFLGMELYEFNHLVHEGHSWRESAFLSAFFTLVGTHGLHILSGLIWVSVLMGQMLKKGITVHTTRRLALFSMFWHFLDIVWIFIFTIVYLMGVL